MAACNALAHTEMRRWVLQLLQHLAQSTLQRGLLTVPLLLRVFH